VRRAVIGLVVLASILLGSLAAGSPVNGAESVASRTAGIELAAAAHPAPRLDAAIVNATVSRHLVQLLAGLLVVGAAVLMVESIRAKSRSVLRWQGSARRGPPAFA